MSDPTKWQPLWDKCDELWPDGLCVATDGSFSLLMEADGGATTIAVDLPHAAGMAMIGYKAVWWLAKRQWTAVQHFEEAIVSRVHCDSGDPIDVDDIGMDPDPTEALRLAVAKVLGVEP